MKHFYNMRTGESTTEAGDAPSYPEPPKTPEEHQAEIDALTAQIDTGRSIIRALGVEVFMLAKAADPSLTPAQFKQRIRDRIGGF